ncbi:RHS repeat-associated core domain-containing protein [Empedobacter falsenii]
MVYDKQDRLVGVQDENMRNENYWIFTKYDKFGRVAITGKTWEAEGRTRDQIQTTINDHLGNNNVSRDATGYTQDNIKIYYNEAGFGYNNHVLTVNYYDDYPMTQEGVSLTGNAFTQTIATGDQLKGLPTLTVTRSLGTWENNQWNFEYNYTFYDNNYLRAIKNHKINYLGGSTIVESELDFRGKAKQVITTHKRLKTDTPLKVTEVFSYDKFERLTKHTHQINSGKIEVLTQNSYNNIGQLTSKNVGNTIVSPYQTVDYTYNIRGWLTQINDITNLGTDLFAFKINYNTKDQTKASPNTQELFNGNISQTFWTSQDNPHIRSYDYNYDGLNRLINASYTNLAKDFAGAYDEQLSYDHNGNIRTLKRYGQTEQATPRLIDNLVYDYENGDRSNKLQKVTDSSLTFGFNDGNKTGNDYAYDKNGNLKLDLNKGITDSISYNHLNLPILVKKGVGSIEYAYDASGAKLRKIVKSQEGVSNVIITTITEYLDGFQYKDGVLQFFPTTEGYVNAITDGTISYNYVYNLTDHLGNVRVSYAWDEVNNTLKTVNEDHYYPFGLQHKGYTRSAAREIVRESDLIEIGIGLAAPGGGSTSGSANYKYKYNGKELQDELGFGMYTFGFRDYMPDIGRFTTIDPMADFVNYQSPYVMADNNPVIYEDVYGLGIINAIGNLLKRVFNGIAGAIIPRSMQSCSCNYKTKESLGDAFRRPDFPGRGSNSSSRSPSSSSSTPSNGNNKAVSTIDIPEAGLAINDFSPEISGNINIPNLSSQIPSKASNGANLFQEVVNRPTNNRIDMSIDFDNKSTNIRKSPLNEKALNDLVQVLQADAKLRVLILGNVWSSNPSKTTDQTMGVINGSAGTVGDLKVGRARAVEAFLIERGVDPKRVRVGSGRTGSDRDKDISTTFIFK